MEAELEGTGGEVGDGGHGGADGRGDRIKSDAGRSGGLQLCAIRLIPLEIVKAGRGRGRPSPLVDSLN